jgi:polysaccharide deacetylase family protein (PEP-CTERM system associated)
MVDRILTVDFEDWFHVGVPRYRDPATWRGLPFEIERDVADLLDFLDEYGARATFFVVGWLAERAPETLQEVVRRGHELGIHSYYHIPPSAMTEKEFRRDILRCRDIVAGIAGVEARGYRAPYFGVRGCSFPYLDVLGECGFDYDSSVCPRDARERSACGAAGARREGAWSDSSVREIPVSGVPLLGGRVLYAGGGYMRLLPACLTRWGSLIATRSGAPTVYYIHPRDLNPHGRMVEVSALQRLRYYGGRASIRRKLSRILESSSATSVEGFLAREQMRPLPLPEGAHPSFAALRARAKAAGRQASAVPSRGASPPTAPAA